MGVRVPPPAHPLLSLTKISMAQISREQIAPLHERLKITVSAADYTPGFDKALKNYAKSANIPGFRKGMVPIGVIKRMHGAAVFTEEVLHSIENELTNTLFPYTTLFRSRKSVV